MLGDSVEKLELKSGLRRGVRQLKLPYCPFGRILRALLPGLWVDWEGFALSRRTYPVEGRSLAGEFGHATEILSDACKREFVSCASQATQT